ncbi:MAG: hypothetical protein ACM30I_06875 [Gemmatimonas sp.]
MKSSRSLGVALALLVAATLVHRSASAGGLSVTSGVDYSSGKYGDAASTEIWYVPLIGKYELDAWTFKLTVPYIRVTGPGNVVRDVGAIRPGAAVRRTDEGMGDIVAGITRTVYERDGTLAEVTGKAKFGTADESKGLGTGANDYYGQLDLYHTVDRFTPFAGIGYRLTGDAPGVPLRDVFYGTVGTSYRLEETTSAGLSLDMREKSTASGAPQAEATAFVTRRLSDPWKLQVYAVRGFTNASADWGAGATVTRMF